MKQFFSNPIVTFIARVILGLIFILYSIDKIAAPEAFAASIQAYQIVPYPIVNLIAIILPWAELVCGMFLMAGIYVRANAMLISLMLIIFLAGMAIAMMRGLNIDCGCFGQEHAEKIGWKRIIEDVGMLILGIQLYLFPKSVLSVGGESPVGRIES